jgi:hypothetical protein
MGVSGLRIEAQGLGGRARGRCALAGAEQEGCHGAHQAGVVGNLPETVLEDRHRQMRPSGAAVEACQAAVDPGVPRVQSPRGVQMVFALSKVPAVDGADARDTARVRVLGRQGEGGRDLATSLGGPSGIAQAMRQMGVGDRMMGVGGQHAVQRHDRGARIAGVNLADGNLKELLSAGHGGVSAAISPSFESPSKVLRIRCRPIRSAVITACQKPCRSWYSRNSLRMPRRNSHFASNRLPTHRVTLVTMPTASQVTLSVSVATAPQ